MESEAQMGPRRYTAYLIIGLIVALAFAGTGIGALVSGQAVLGWVMLIAGVAISILSIVRLVLARRSG
ncbi:hypothetical protein ACTU3I_01100 [Microbacterium sp. RD1]|uniref:hypothetical protein n=1 Tax=Microbacterium sp. RD1 TaxID=3457313 RepID=UPI003FA55B03